MDTLVNAVNVSVVARIEVLGFNGTPEGMQKLEAFLNTARMFYVDDHVAQQTSILRKTYKKLKLGDALIAATALIHDFTLFTRNTDDFKNIAGLRIQNPHELMPVG